MKIETNAFKRAWIWFWYSDFTRLVFVMLGGHLAVTVPCLYYMGVTGEALRMSTMLLYAVVFFLAACDNDFTNLNRIGLDVYRRPLARLNLTKDF